MVNPDFGKFLLSQMSDGAMVVDIESGIITFANESAGSFFELPQTELIGNSILDVCGHPIDFFVKIAGSSEQSERVLCKLPDQTERKFEVRSGFASTEKIIIIFSQLQKEQQKVIDLLQKYVDLSTLLMVELSPEGIVRKVNKACLTLLQVKEEEIIGKDWFENFIPESIRKGLREGFDLVVSGKKEISTFNVNPVLSSKGEFIDISWHNLVLIDNEGNITGTLGAGEDVSEKQGLVSRLLTSRAHYRRLFENMKEAVIQLDADGRIMMVNPAFEKMMDYKEDQVKGRKLLDFFSDKESLDIILPQMDRRKKGLSDIYELPVKTSTGAKKWLQVRVAPILEKSGDLIGSISFSTDITEKKELESALERKERKIQSILKVIPDKIALVDLKGELKFLNQENKGDFQVFEELKDNGNIFSILDKETGDSLKERIAEAIETGNSTSLEYGKKVNSNLLFFEARIVKHDQEHALVIIRNVTDETRLQREYENMRQRQKAMLAAINDQILMVDETGLCIEYKPGVTKSLDLAAKGKVLDQIFPVEIASLHNQKLKQGLSDGKSIYYEYREQHNAQARYFEATIAPYGGKEAFVIIREVTERKRAVSELLRNRQLYAQAEVLARLGSWEHDVEAETTRFSDHLYRLFGFEPGDQAFTLEVAISMVDQEDMGALHQTVKESIEKNEEFKTTISVRLPHDEKMDLLVVGRARMKGDKVNTVTGVVQDITLLKKLERDLKERNAELSTFIYRTSHSLRSPLTSALGLINLAKQENKGPAMPYINMIDDLIRRLDHILLELINAVMIKGGEIHIAPINLFDFTSSLIHDYQYSEMFEEVSFRVLMPLDLTVNTDGVLLRAIMSNLVENSIKYRKSKGNTLIVIEAEAKNSGFRISVEDNGVGIANEAQERVFEMFFRANDAIAGTGMGLYIVKNAVDKLHGQINLLSTTKIGTKIIIDFPDYN